MAGVIAQSPGSSNGADELTWKRFIDGGIQGISEAVVVPGGHRVNISWMDGHESVFSLKWLRDHSNGSFNVNTKQREVRTFTNTSTRERKQHAKQWQRTYSACGTVERGRKTVVLVRLLVL